MPRCAVFLVISVAQLLVTEADDWELDDQRALVGQMPGRLCASSPCLPSSEAERVVDASYFLQLGLNLALRPSRITRNKEPGPVLVASPPLPPEAAAHAPGLAEVRSPLSVDPEHAAAAQAPGAAGASVTSHSQSKTRSKKASTAVGSSPANHSTSNAVSEKASAAVGSSPANHSMSNAVSEKASLSPLLPEVDFSMLAAPNDTNTSNISNVSIVPNVTNVTDVTNITEVANVTNVTETLGAKVEANVTNISTTNITSNEAGAGNQSNEATNITGNATEPGTQPNQTEAGRNTSLGGVNTTETSSSGIARELEGRQNSVGMTPALRKRTLISSIIFLLIMLFVIGSLIFLVLLRRTEQP